MSSKFGTNFYSPSDLEYALKDRLSSLRLLRYLHEAHGSEKSKLDYLIGEIERLEKFVGRESELSSGDLPISFDEDGISGSSDLESLIKSFTA
ncbi:hypothetical protein cd3_056 [Carnobacterium phage cd3]|uniref:Uncharacterized protein n=2 Tax=Carnodivirus TaxID=3044682 RepID=A0AAE7SRJ3_9CAUD|nr:hypothetical protein PQD68_gp056 [Carnobacterium phage cd2]YP_010676521.1 hypothetical protein PQD69_gp055 [Carnobacterium phage cd4]QXP45182.1 hypothetical protein cd2_056 [Carnobacterium phage cd2]QXP45262.1 hypothetical protein cd3_056 [Carnobacterium phage cd3]QXP45346.1 hypothetical protein cd4_055 [Carnobacterium phage cd4]